MWTYPDKERAIWDGTISANSFTAPIINTTDITASGDAIVNGTIVTNYIEASGAEFYSTGVVIEGDLDVEKDTHLATISGNVGIGTASPGAKLEVSGNIFGSGAMVVDSTAPIANAVRVTGEYMLTADNELNYDSSFTDGMSAQTVTFTELPAKTIAVLMYIGLADTVPSIRMDWKRSSGDTQTFSLYYLWGDGGTNRHHDFVWMPTGGNSIYVNSCAADSNTIFRIVGYKVGE